MNKSIISIIIAVVVVGGGWWLYAGKKAEIPVPVVNTNEGNAAPEAVQGISVNGAPVEIGASVSVGVKEFTVVGRPFSFSPSSLSVKKGDRVRIVFKNAEGFHDLKIDEFQVATKKLNGGEEETVEFTADKAGSFEFYCSIGNHRAMGMKGTLTVAE
ncbi:MAG: hypothetical protein A2946_02745 [Candidatus Liptonbacteria bacterium RIFCSPLOWO2_01_FULL_53_13]|uniref:EfeO-type cupredoxin-like domain-containing protein n=1 Tax=Candidatus Liptonbacteria bacterium RIFCSPLOWO2_01_FULL_53_13 TaxID=1798651 RepID=A0A1G2CM62_9BACT|nr:MAG: hypothetical protein A2946_02745 [Candidatus Liptonbacteria bacterium RIFCSPLOWO2_01_FULL_53_13]